jgi:hypothetical protein
LIARAKKEREEQQGSITRLLMTQEARMIKKNCASIFMALTILIPTREN